MPKLTEEEIAELGLPIEYIDALPTPPGADEGAIMSQVEQCNYQGYEFGSPYPDSVCIGGRLYDADSGYADPSGDGWLYDEPDEDIPCPMCRPKEAIAWHRRRGNKRAKELVADIRKNREKGTEPWKRK